MDHRVYSISHFVRLLTYMYFAKERTTNATVYRQRVIHKQVRELYDMTLVICARP